MSKAKALDLIEKTSLPKPKEYSKFSSFDDADRILSKNESSGLELPPGERVIEIDPSEIKIWDLKDQRIETAASKKKQEDLIDRIKLHGQLTACFVKPVNDPKFKYELIAGRRRFLAAQALGIKLKAIIKDVSDNDALIIQHEENKRDDPTDYERGLFYQRLLDNGTFSSQAEIARFYQEDRQDISKVLSYFKMPQELQQAIDNFDNVTSTTAEALASIASKSQEHLKALISLADIISQGKGHSTIRKLVENIINGKTKRESFVPKKVINAGRHLLTWKMDQNDNICIAFPSSISDILPQQTLESTIVDLINNIINQTHLSPGGQKSTIDPNGGQS